MTASESGSLNLAALNLANSLGAIGGALLIDAGWGPRVRPFWYRLLVGHAPLDPAQAPAHVEQILHGLRQRTQ